MLKLLNVRGRITTSLPFDLVTKFTVYLLAAMAVLISSRQWFGWVHFNKKLDQDVSKISFYRFRDPIVCDVDQAKRYLLETKCWIDGVYLIEELINGTVGDNITKWGVGEPVYLGTTRMINQAYHQWSVPIISLIALLLSLPRAIYCLVENGQIEKLLEPGCESMSLNCFHCFHLTWIIFSF